MGQMGGASRVLIVHNPVAGRRRPGLLSGVVAALERRGLEVHLRPTASPDDAEAFGRDVSADTYDVVVAAGGDGTINGVVNGLMRAAAPPPLALLPMGTANVLAAEIGLATGVEDIAAAIAGGTCRAVYPGRANGRYFLLMAGAGFDAWVVAHVRGWLKRLIGKGAYVVEALWQAVRYGYPTLTVQVDGQPYAARSVVVCKGRRYGGPHVLAPAADLSEPSLEVCLLTAAGPLSQLRSGIALARGRLVSDAHMTIVRGKTVEVTCATANPVQCDGDITCTLPLTITVSDTPLWMLVPR